MKKTDINKIKSTYRIGLFISGIILCIELFVLFNILFGNSFKVFSDLVVSIENTSYFFDFISAVWIVWCLVMKARKWPLLAINILNIVLINHLYSNQTWETVAGVLLILLKNRYFYVVLAVVFIVFLVVVIAINRKRFFPELSSWLEKEKQSDNDEEKNQKEGTEQDAKPGQESKEGTDAGKETAPQKEKQAKPKPPLRPRRLTFGEKILIFVCVGCISWMSIDYLLFDYFSALFTRPDNVERVVNALRYVAGIATAVLVAYLIGTLFFSFSRNENLSPRGSAFAALFLEAVLFLGGDRITEWGIVDKFLDGLSDNSFAIILVVILVFMLLHIGFIIFANFFFVRGNRRSAVYSLFSERLKVLEEKLVRFAFNILDGIMELFNFIPDFFNTIGALLLDKPDLFGVSLDEGKADAPETESSDSGDGTDTREEV